MSHRTTTMWAALIATFALSGAAIAQTPTPIGQPGPEFSFVEDSSRIAGPNTALTTNDVREKDYDWGDVDLDGDIDLVCVRKQPFTSAGKDPNVLFMNVNGVLTDMTAMYASAALAPASDPMVVDNGFLTPTNDRDVKLVDVDDDGWLDIVTVTTLSDGDPKHISHPRIYMNLGNDPMSGDWLGFQYEPDRIPQLAGLAPGGQPHAPRFCSVDFGDVDGDGSMDLYFGDYDSGGGQTLDFNDRLLINDGNGFFTDETASKFFGTIIVNGNPQQFQLSAFGTSIEMADFNGDGKVDIAKDTALNVPQYVGIAYNNTVPAAPALGDFGQHETVNTLAPYFIESGDLNNDGRIDLLAMDDGTDRFHLNLGNDTDGIPNWTTQTFNFANGGGDPGFPGNAIIADFNNDGWNDVAHADVDVDISGCNRQMRMYRNMANPAFTVSTGDPNLNTAATITMQSDTVSAGWLPTGVHDIGAFDIDGDGLIDMVLGTCSGTEVWMNDLGGDLSFDLPTQPPVVVSAGTPVTFQVDVMGDMFATPAAGSLEFFLSTNGGAFQAQSVTDLGSDSYEVTIPGGSDMDTFDYYFRAETTDGGMAVFPDGAPGNTFTTIVGELAFVDDIETANPGWQIDSSATGGVWERGIPNGTTQLLLGVEVPAAPSSDRTPGGQYAYVTGNNASTIAGVDDVDEGPNLLTSPLLDLSNGGLIIFDLWYQNVEDNAAQEDECIVEISNDDGMSWETALTVTGLTQWQTYSIDVATILTPTAQMRVRFNASDAPNNSITECAVDNLIVIGSSAPAAQNYIAGDIDSDASFDIGDTIQLLGYLFQGASIPCEKAADINTDGALGLPDVIAHLQALFGSGGAQFPQPYPGCGTDPIGTVLTCDSFPGCP